VFVALPIGEPEEERKKKKKKKKEADRQISVITSV
jgi:hypothetical protein